MPLKKRFVAAAGCQTYVFFHASDVYLYREPLVLEAHEVMYDILPVGLNVRFDALTIRSDCQEVKTLNRYLF